MKHFCVRTKRKPFGARGELNSQNRGRARADPAGELGSSEITKKQENPYVYNDLGSFWGIVSVISVCRKNGGFRAIRRLRTGLGLQNSLKPL